MKKDTVAIVTSGYFPVPVAMGGAVEALDENLLKQNEIDNRLHFVVFSCYNEKAKCDSVKYKNSSFVFVKTPWIIRLGDKIVYRVAKDILKKRKSMSYRYIFQRLYYIERVAQYLHRNNYDKIVIENHSTLFWVLKKYDNAKKYAGRFYYHLHNVVTNGYGCNDIMGKCKRVIGVSNYINDTLKDFLGVNDKNIYSVLRNRIDKKIFMVDLSKEERHALRENYNINDEDIVFLFCGRFNEEKGIRQLLKAFEQTDGKCKLLVVGGYYYGSGMTNTFEEEMYSFVNKKLSERVEFTGQIDYSLMPKIYALADVVVIPSIWDDPAPLTVIESLSSGKALITTDSGGIPEYADTESCIILKRDENLVENLARAMDILAKSKNERNRMSEAALQKTQSWNIETYYKDFCNILIEE